MLNTDKRDEAERFIETVIAPRRSASPVDRKYLKARSDLEAEDVKLAKTEIAASGIDFEKLDKLAAQRSGKRKKLADERHQRAIEESGNSARRLWGIGPIAFPIEPIDTVINEMLFIRSYADQGSVFASNIAPLDNWARYKMVSDSDYWDGTGRLSFFALWQNPQDEIAVILAKPQLIVNARLKCDADWSGVASWFGMSSIAKATVVARTTVWGMTAGISSVVNEKELAKIDIDGGFFGDDGAANIEINQMLEATGVVVPPNAYVMVEVEIFTVWTANGGGSVVLDAESGSHRIDVPQILISHVGTSMPPPEPQPGMITLTASVSGGGGSSGYAVTLAWAGAAGARVDIYQNGLKIADTENDGSFSVQVGSGNYTFRVCQTQPALCSPDVSVTVP